MLGIDPKTQRQIDGFIKLCKFGFLQKRNRFLQGAFAIFLLTFFDMLPRLPPLGRCSLPAVVVFPCARGTPQTHF
jgi:hypothetical protein